MRGAGRVGLAGDHRPADDVGVEADAADVLAHPVDQQHVEVVDRQPRRRGRRASVEQRRLDGRRCRAAGTAWHQPSSGRARSRRCATPSTMLPWASTCRATRGISSRRPHVPWACRASACTRLPRPIAVIFISPLSYGPWKSVCCLTRLTTIVAAAAAAWASVTIGTGRSCSPATGDDVHRRAHLAALPAVDEAVRLEHLALALGGGAAVAAHRRDEERRRHPGRAPTRRSCATTVVRSAMPTRPDGDGHLAAGRAGATPQSASVRSVAAATSSSDGSSSRTRTRWNRTSSLTGAPRELPGVVEGVLQGVGEGDALPGDVERRAVVDRGADDRQPERDVDARCRTPAASSARGPGRGTCTRSRRSGGGARPGGTRCRPGAGRWRRCPRRGASSIAGAMRSMSSPPNRPCSPACGLRPQTAMRGASRNRRSVASVSSITSSTRRGCTRSIASRSEQWVLTWVTASELPSVERRREHHRHPLHAAQLGDHLGVADERRVGELRRLLVHRHRHDRRRPGRRARRRWRAAT